MVQKDGKNSYLLMSGQRRLAALKRLGAKKIPVLLTNATKYDLEDAKAASVVFVPNKLSRDDCTRLYQTISNVPKAVKIAERIIPLDQKLRKEYLKSLARSPKSSHLKLLKKAKAGLFQQKVIIDLTKGNARKLRSLANRKDVDVTDMADEILSNYLKKR